MQNSIKCRENKPSRQSTSLAKKAVEVYLTRRGNATYKKNKKQNPEALQ